MPRPKSTNCTLDFVIQAKQSVIIDMARCLSLVNRKSYRSGYVYSVDYMEYIGDAGDLISVHKLPEGYITLRSWSNAFEIWKQQRSESMDNTETSPGKWSDFKAWWDVDHQSGALAELTPSGAGGFVYPTTGSEWNRAEIEVNDPGAATTTTYHLGMLGPTATPYGGVIQEWGNTRAGTVAPDPNVPGALSLSILSRTGEESSAMSTEVLNLIESENDDPPYANVTDPTLDPIYAGGITVAGGVFSDRSVTGTTGRAVSLNGGLFPLGLIRLELAGASVGEVAPLFRIHMTRGEYKGVAALKCGDFS